MSVAEMQATPALTTKDMPYVTFETKTIEDRKASREQKKPVFKDQDYARITPPGSRDVQLEKLPEWFDKIEQDVRGGRLPMQWVDNWRSAYARYRAGQAIPVDGTPIKGWGLLTGSQQENLVRMNVLTVEALANINADAMSHIGMGALELKRRAEGWLAQSKDKTAISIEIAALKQENDVLKTTVQTLTDKLDTLAKQIDKNKPRRGKAVGE
jgi:cell division protein FtsB